MEFLARSGRTRLLTAWRWDRRGCRFSLRLKRSASFLITSHRITNLFTRNSLPGLRRAISATGYMAHEGGYYRFFSYLNLFMFFMLMLVLAANYVLLFVGWEGVGLSSYLLIGFYFLRKSAADAGKKAFIVNRIGDFGFMLGMFLLFRTFNTLDFNTLFTAVHNANLPREGWGVFGTFTIACLLLFMGACGRSAQLPLYVWLPDAMEGPTPVSALIHAATMVTAG